MERQTKCWKSNWNSPLSEPMGDFGKSGRWVKVGEDWTLSVRRRTTSDDDVELLGVRAGPDSEVVSSGPVDPDELELFDSVPLPLPLFDTCFGRDPGSL